MNINTRWSYHQRQQVKLHQPLEPSSENHRGVVKRRTDPRAQRKCGDSPGAGANPNTHTHTHTNPGKWAPRATRPALPPRYTRGSPAPLTSEAHLAPDMSTRRRFPPAEPAFSRPSRPPAPPADSDSGGRAANCRFRRRPPGGRALCYGPPSDSIRK